MKKLGREDLYKLIYMAAEELFKDDVPYKTKRLGKKKENVEFKDLTREDRNEYVELVKEEVFKNKMSITTGSNTRMQFRGESPEERISEYANYNFYNELMSYYNDEEYLEDFEEDNEELYNFIQEELEKENDEFYERYQSMEEKEYDFEQEFEEEEELSEQELLEKKIETLKNMPKEDFQRLVYMTALEVSNKKVVFGKNENSLLEKEEEEKNTYITCAQKSALKSFYSHPDLVLSTLISMGKDTPKELKQIIAKQLLFDAVYNEIFEDYMLAIDKEKFFVNCDKNLGEDISKVAIEEMNTEMAQEFFKKIEESKQNFNHDDKIKSAVVEFWLECLKEKNPDLSEENQKKFSDRLMQYINRSYDSWTGSRLSVDYDPCDELKSAYYAMDIKQKMFGPNGEFPFKTNTYTEKGKYARVSSDYKESKYLYMSPEYLEKQKNRIQEQIEKEEAKIPEEIKKQWEQEYQEEISKLEEERIKLVKKQEEIERIEEEQNLLEQKAEELLCSYLDRIEELEHLSLTEKEKNQRKQEIMQETQYAIERIESNKANYRQIAEKYNTTFNTLEQFEEYNKNVLDKNAWTERKKLHYIREQHKLRHEEWKKTHNDFSWPDTSDLPTSDLNRIYLERDLIKKYEQEKQQESNQEEQTVEGLNEEMVQAISKAYLESTIKNKSFLEDNKKKAIQKNIYEYLKANSSKLLNSKFLVNFENGELETIKERYYISDRYSFHISKSEPSVKIEKDIVVYSDGFDTKIYYGHPETIERKIREIESKIRFCKDIGKHNLEAYRLEKDKQSYKDYLEQIKERTEKSLLELDIEKQKLEKIEQNARESLNQYKVQEESEIGQ